jgi:hypothetical protein
MNNKIKRKKKGIKKKKNQGSGCPPSSTCLQERNQCHTGP